MKSLIASLKSDQKRQRNGCLEGDNNGGNNLKHYNVKIQEGRAEKLLENIRKSVMVSCAVIDGI